MMDVFRAQLVPMGDSYGIRLSKPIVERLGLQDEVELIAQAKQLVVRAVQPLPDWAAQLQHIPEGEAGLRSRNEIPYPEGMVPQDWDLELAYEGSQFQVMRTPFDRDLNTLSLPPDRCRYGLSILRHSGHDLSTPEEAHETDTLYWAEGMDGDMGDLTA